VLFKAAKFFLYAAVFAIVIVSTATLFPFIVGKYAWFRAMVDLALVCFFAGLLVDWDNGRHYITRLKQVWRSPVFIAVTVFAAVFVLAGFFGVRPSFSFWSNFERGEGGVQILHLYAFFVLLATLFREDKDWRKMFWLSMVAASLMILYGVLVGFGGHIGSWGTMGVKFGIPGFRFQGSFGNSEYVPGYLAFMLFFASYLLLGAKRGWRSPQSIGIIVLMFLFVIFSIMSGTRGGFLGLMAGALTALAYIGFYKKHWRKWLILGAVLALVAVALLVEFREFQLLQKIPGVSSILRLRLNEQDLADLTTRFEVWDIAVQGWKERPLFGWGPENFRYLYERHYEIQYFSPESGFGRWFDRAHSTVFDYLSQIGLLGLVSYLAVFVTLGLLLLKKKWHEAAKANEKRMILQGLFVGILVTYLVQGTVLFDALALYLPLFTLFAFALYYFPPGAPGASQSEPTGQIKPSPITTLVSIFGILLAALALYFGSLLPYLKAKSYIGAERQLVNVRTVDDFGALFDASFNLYSPVGDEEIAKFLGSNVYSMIQNQPEDVARDLAAYVEGRMLKDDLHHLMTLGHIYKSLWVRFGDEAAYLKAEEYYQKAHEIGANLPLPIYALFDLYGTNHDKDNIERMGTIILEKWPQDEETHKVLDRIVVQ